MPRNKYPEQTVEKILSAAERLFAQKSYAKTTLQDIIDTTGLSKGAVYHHFKSKEEIAAKVGDRLGARVAAELARIRDDAALTGLQKLQTVFAVSLLPGGRCGARLRVQPEVGQQENCLAQRLRRLGLNTAVSYPLPNHGRDVKRHGHLQQVVVFHRKKLRVIAEVRQHMLKLLLSARQQ